MKKIFEQEVPEGVDNIGEYIRTLLIEDKCWVFITQRIFSLMTSACVMHNSNNENIILTFSSFKEKIYINGNLLAHWKKVSLSTAVRDPDVIYFLS